jgi:hypothetical protein
VLENRMLRSKEDEGAADCRELYNEEIHNLCSSLNIVRGTNQGG